MALARTLLALAFTGCATLLLAAPDASPVIDVTANRLDSNSYTSPYGELSVAEQAASIPGVRLLRQGLGSPQADLRIRGGAFSSSGFALEGLALFNPQTEHFHADLPIVPLMTESPRLLTGMEQFRQMSGHASGTVAMDLAVPEDYAKFDLTAGSRASSPPPPPSAGTGPPRAAPRAAAPFSPSMTRSTRPTDTPTTTSPAGQPAPCSSTPTPGKGRWAPCWAPSRRSASGRAAFTARPPPSPPRRKCPPPSSSEACAA